MAARLVNQGLGARAVATGASVELKAGARARRQQEHHVCLLRGPAPASALAALAVRSRRTPGARLATKPRRREPPPHIARHRTARAAAQAARAPHLCSERDFGAGSLTPPARAACPTAARARERERESVQSRQEQLRAALSHDRRKGA